MLTFDSVSQNQQEPYNEHVCFLKDKLSQEFLQLVSSFNDESQKVTLCNILFFFSFLGGRENKKKNNDFILQKVTLCIFSL